MPNPKGLNFKGLGKYRLDWRGDSLLGVVRNNVKQAWGEVGLRVEGEAKKQLYKGHGVRTGTLRRSIHTAAPGYNWAADDVAAAAGTPERGGQLTLPTLEFDGIVIQVGSGLVYALAIHQGFDSFDGYHYLRNGARIVTPQIPAILNKYHLSLQKRR